MTSRRSYSPALPLFIAIFAAAVLGGALYIQAQGEAPCPLCILQRIGYLAVLVAALLAVAFNRSALLRNLLLLVGAVGAVGGLIAALRHVWIALHPAQTCGLDPLAVQINNWTITHWVPWMFQANGICSDVPREFGLPLPAWAAIGFVFCIVLLLAALRGRRR